MARLRTRNRSALAAATLLTVVLAAGVSGCAGSDEDPLPVPAKMTAQPPEPTVTLTPIPSPSTTPGEDPEADVAAAIETYYAYIEASNKLVLADETTWKPVFALTTGDTRDLDESQFAQQKDQGNKFVGKSTIVTVESRSVNATRVELDSCLDVSEFGLVGKDGVSLVDEAREEIQPMLIVLVPNPAAAESPAWLISEIYLRQDGAPC